MQRRTLIGGLLAAPALVQAARAQALVLRVGDQRGGIQLLMDATGVLAGAPFRVEWAQFAGAPMLLKALHAGAIDTGGIGDAPFSSAVAVGILTTSEECDAWLAAPAAEALTLQRPLPNDALVVVARGEKQDPPGIGVAMKPTLLL